MLDSSRLEIEESMHRVANAETSRLQMASEFEETFNSRLRVRLLSRQKHTYYSVLRMRSRRSHARLLYHPSKRYDFADFDLLRIRVLVHR